MDVGSHLDLDVDFSDAFMLILNYPRSKQHSFFAGWRLLLNRLPAKDELAKTCIPYGVFNLVYPICLCPESQLHLFLLCFITSRI